MFRGSFVLFTFLQSICVEIRIAALCVSKLACNYSIVNVTEQVSVL